MPDSQQADERRGEFLANGFRVWDDRKADETYEVKLKDGHKVAAYSYGSGDEVVFLLNGGPGLPCNYLRDPHVPLVEHGYRVVTHDQLGTGASDHPEDPSLWTLERYVEEVETVLAALDLKKVHFLGHSWGGWCGIEWALTHPERVKSMIWANTCADIPHLMQEIDGLRDALGSETVAMMQRYEALGRYEHPAYAAAVTMLDYRHIRRLPYRPKPAAESKMGFNAPIYMQIQGPNEYHYIGSICSWNRIADLHRLTQPCLIINGQHDVLTPACGRRMKDAMKQAEIRIFANSSHSPFFEEPEAYRTTLLDFLGRHRG
jgi:proline iminopeptidase